MELKHITGQVRALPADVKDTRTVEFVISSENKDRHGTVIPIDNWDLDNFNKNGIVGYQHEVYGSFFGGSDPDSVIGKGKAWVEGDKLIGSVTFEPAELNPLAEKIFQKILFGSLTSTSVGFMEKTAGELRADDPNDPKSPRTYYYGAVELLEFSVVNIPSNSEAVKRAHEEEAREAIRKIVKEVINEEGEDPQPEDNPQPAEAEHYERYMAKIRLQELEINQ